MITYTVAAALLPMTTEYTMNYNDQVVDETCRAFKVDKKLLSTPIKTEKIKFARWVIWQILHVYDPASTVKTLGGMFGMDHTSVCNALDKLPWHIKKNLFLDSIFRSICGELKIDIAEIEEAQKIRQRKKGTVSEKTQRQKMAQYESHPFIPIERKYGLR